MTLIQTFSDGSSLSFDYGKFDRWCVYLEQPNQPKHAPTDLQYFMKLRQLGQTHGCKKIYNDFLKFYTLTSKNIEQPVLDLISKISTTYNDDALEIEILFTIIYAGMIAEENKEFTKLKKRIKRLGIHQTLIDKESPEFASNFSKGKKWRELDQLCKAKGF